LSQQSAMDWKMLLEDVDLKQCAISGHAATFCSA
jgi:hypothetical protein